MSYLFQTDNIFYLPPGEPLQIYDIIHWRRIDLPVQSAFAQINPAMAGVIKERAALALSHAQQDQPGLDPLVESERMDRFLAALPFSEAGDKVTGVFETLFDPLRPIFWVRFSQQPLESFFPEDYEPSPSRQEACETALSCIGGISFNALGDFVCDLPSENPYSIRVSLVPGDSILQAVRLDPFEPLPLLEEYCGLLGSSNKGRAVTIDLAGEVPEHLLAAIPMGCDEAGIYQTLYLHLDTEVEVQPIRPFHPPDAANVASALKTAGFHPRRREKQFSVWERDGGDVIQIYRNLPGKESEGVRILPPFCLAVLAGGSTDVYERHELLKRVL